MQVEFEDRIWDFSYDAIDLAQARYIKNHTGLSMSGLLEGMREMDPEAAAATYWAMKTQNGVVVDIGKVNFPLMQYCRLVGAAFKKEIEEREARPTTPGAKRSTSSATRKSSDS